MLTIEKNNFTRLKNGDQVFFDLIKKLILHQELTNDEKVYLLSCAIAFLRKYEQDKRYTSYADFAYYIILHYTIVTQDYLPLYDFATNFGFYPITNEILKIRGFNEKSLIDCFLSNELEQFKNITGDYIETLEQNNVSKKFLNSVSYEKSYIAPTSFGKSSLIIDFLKKEENLGKKVAIIVPTKSLLTQTYKNIVRGGINTKIMLHEGMYANEQSFVGIFTQERGLRMMEIHQVYYDILVVDEAHNLFEGDSRAVLLSRLIKKNKKLNPNQKVIYLSPLIQNSDNLRVNRNQSILPFSVVFNIKEPNLYEYHEVTKEISLYNRFLGEFYLLGSEVSRLQYIINSSSEKNFLYESKPKDIENLALKLTQSLPIVNSELLYQLKTTLQNQVHEKFTMINTLNFGVVYLHGKLPDIIKEYIETKFKKISSIKYLVANNVILEGINLPIDSLYICGYYKLTSSKILNLIGRVNRLGDIFNNEQLNFQKLTPNIHFLCDSENGNHHSKFKELRSRFFEDHIINPTLESYSLESVVREKSTDESKEKYREEILRINAEEDIIYATSSTGNDSIKKNIIEMGISEYYHNIDLLVSNFMEQKEQIKYNYSQWGNLNMLDKIHKVFFCDLENISNDEFKRLNYEETRNYYENHILLSLKKSLKENINSQCVYLLQKSESENPYLYIGLGFGEEPYPYLTEGYSSPWKKVYVNLRGKNDEYFVNLSIVKLKIEEDFISFTLSKFIEFLYTYELITINEYNKYTYGTDDERKIMLTKTGLSISLISRLERDNQLHNLYLDQNNNLGYNEDFSKFLDKINDFYRFEIERHLVI